MSFLFSSTPPSSLFRDNCAFPDRRSDVGCRFFLSFVFFGLIRDLSPHIGTFPPKTLLSFLWTPGHLLPPKCCFDESSVEILRVVVSLLFPAYRSFFSQTFFLSKALLPATQKSLRSFHVFRRPPAERLGPSPSSLDLLSSFSPLL